MIGANLNLYALLATIFAGLSSLTSGLNIGGL